MKTKLPSAEALTLILYQIIIRIIGILKESLIIFKLGVGQASDIAMFAFNIPDLLFGITLGDMIPSYLMPRLQSKDKSTLVSSILGETFKKSITFASILTLIILVFDEDVLKYFATGLPVQEIGPLIVVGSISLILLAGISFFRTIINFEQKFFLLSLDGVVANTGFIFSVFLIDRTNLIFELSLAILVVSSIRLFVAVYSSGINLKRINFELTPFTLPREDLFFLASYLFFNIFFNSVPYLARSLASSYGEGAYTIFTYSQRLSDIPSSIGTAVTLAIFLPKFSKNFTLELRKISEIFCLILFLTSLAIISTFIFEKFLLMNIFKASGEITENLLGLLRIGLLTAPAKIIITIFSSYFISKKSFLSLNIAGALCFSLYLALTLWFRGLGIEFQMIAYLFFYYILLVVLAFFYKKDIKNNLPTV